VLQLQIYMDVCCFNRPFDNLSQDRVYLEAEAVLSIISRCEAGLWVLMSSGAIDFELARISDADKMAQVQTIYASASKRVNMTNEIEQRAAILQQHGLKPFDALHLATAEIGGADVFLTTDDRLLKTSTRLNLKIRVANPIIWLMEVSLYEQ